MPTTVHKTTTVLPGNRIEIVAPELREGQAVDVFLVVSATGGRESSSALDAIRSLQGHRFFSSSAEADAYLATERNSWDR